MDDAQKANLEMRMEGSLEELLFLYLYRNHEYIDKAFARYFKETCGWTSGQLNILCYLKFYQSMTMSELADKVGSSRQQLSQQVNTLVEKQLVQRQYPPENRRSITVAPTEEAVRLLSLGEAAFIARLSDKICRLPEKEQAELVSSIRLVTRFLNDSLNRREEE